MARIVVLTRPVTAASIARRLLRDGDTCAICSDADELRAVLAVQPRDLLVVAQASLGVDGIAELRRRVGAQLRAAILLVPDPRTYAVAALNEGADDVVGEDVELDELAARVHAVLRRVRAAGPASRLLRHADLALDPVTFEAWRGPMALTLTPTEFGVLRHLLVNATTIVSSEQLLDAVWAGLAKPASVATYVQRVRRKVDIGQPALIHTVRSLGYLLSADAPHGTGRARKRRTAATVDQVRR